VLSFNELTVKDFSAKLSSSISGTSLVPKYRSYAKESLSGSEHCHESVRDISWFVESSAGVGDKGTAGGLFASVMVIVNKSEVSPPRPSSTLISTEYSPASINDISSE
jgi:hypothetical protein